MRQPLYSADQSRELDRRAITAGTPGYALMQRAGQAAFQWLREHWPNATRIVVLVGRGNNGGDGYVLARLAWQAWRQGRRAVAAWLFALPLLLVALGLAQVWLQLPLALVLAHNAASALLLAVLLGMGRLQPGLAGLR